VRKTNPAGVKKDFIAALDGVARTLDEVKNSDLLEPTKLLVAESSLLASAVLWEGFITDLFVANINRDSQRFTANLLSRIEQSVTSKFGPRVAQKVRVALPKHLRKKDVRSLLDQEDRNLSFETAEKMVDRAKLDLPSGVAASFTALTGPERATIDAWHSIRNFIAHRSQSSEDKMNAQLKGADVPLLLRRGTRKIHDAGSWLSSDPSRTQKWRIQHYVSTMKSIAQKL